MRALVDTSSASRAQRTPHDSRARIPALAATAFIVCILLFAAALAAPPAAHAASQPYAQLSGKYESSENPSYASHTAGAWGAYQFTSSNAVAYATWLQSSSSARSSWGDALLAARTLDGGSCGWYFDATWRYIAGGASSSAGSASSDSKSNAARIKKVEQKMKSLGCAKLSNGSRIASPSRSGSLSLQYRYCIKVFYNPAVSAWESSVSAFDADSYTVALQNVIFSTAIQHGVSGSAGVFETACSRAGGFSKISSERKLIIAIYNERSRTVKKAPYSNSVKIRKSSLSQTTLAKAKKYGLIGKYLARFSRCSASTQVGVYVRLRVNEKADALSMLASATSCSHSKTTGGKTLSYYALTDKNHKERISAVVCKSCGSTVRAAHSKTVANVYRRSGAAWKDVSGKAYTVHSKGAYKVTASTLNVRAGPSTSKSVRTTVSKGSTVRVSSSKMGSDGFWWGRVSASGASGWVQMRYLSMYGTASSHSFSNGKCSTCGVSRQTASNIRSVRAAVKKKGSRQCTLVKSARTYANAYTVSSQAVSTLKKGAKVRIVKVVRNAYNDWWGKTAAGTYISLSALR